MALYYVRNAHPNIQQIIQQMVNNCFWSTAIDWPITYDDILPEVSFSETKTSLQKLFPLYQYKETEWNLLKKNDSLIFEIRTN